MVPPPAGVAGVEDVCPADESEGVVDGDPPDVWPRLFPRCFKVEEPVGRAACDDDDGAATPIFPPGRAAVLSAGVAAFAFACAAPREGGSTFALGSSVGADDGRRAGVTGFGAAGLGLLGFSSDASLLRCISCQRCQVIGSTPSGAFALLVFMTKKRVPALTLFPSAPE